jgi:hypothetical protein
VGVSKGVDWALAFATESCCVVGVCREGNFALTVVAVGVSGNALTAAGVDGEVVVLPAARVGGKIGGEKVGGENVGGGKVGAAVKVELDVGLDSVLALDFVLEDF